MDDADVSHMAVPLLSHFMNQSTLELVAVDQSV